MRGTVRPAAERARLVEGCRASGLSVKAFAKREGVPPTTLYKWLSDAKASDAPIRIAKVIRSRASGPSMRAAVEGAIFIEIGAARIHVARGADHSTVDAVLGSLLNRRTAL